MPLLPRKNGVTANIRKQVYKKKGIGRVTFFLALCRQSTRPCYSHTGTDTAPTYKGWLNSEVEAPNL